MLSWRPALHLAFASWLSVGLAACDGDLSRPGSGPDARRSSADATTSSDNASGVDRSDGLPGGGDRGAGDHPAIEADGTLETDALVPKPDKAPPKPDSTLPKPDQSPPPPPPPAGGPVLFFSDLDFGPSTGWEQSSTRGAAVSVWGLNLGSQRGTSFVTVNGAALTAATDYAEWGVTGLASGVARGLQRITFWLNSSCQAGAGQITVNVGGKTSNPLPFTVMPAAIYFVSVSAGNDSTCNGRRATAAGGSNCPYHDIRMFNPSLNPTANTQSTIFYVRGGSYSQLDVDDAYVALRGPHGGPTARHALVGYPAEAPTLDMTAASRGIIWNANYSPYGRNSYFTVAKLKAIGGPNAGTDAVGLWGDYNRVVGNHFKDLLANAWSGVVMVDNSQYSGVYGNVFEHLGYDSYKHNVYIKTHPDYVAGDKSVDHTDVGYNEFADAWAGADARGGVIFVSRAGGTTGKYTADTRIHHNYFHGGNMDFIYVGDSVPIGDVVVYNNVFRGGTSINGGITLYAGTTNASFYNNVFYQIGPSSTAMIWATGAAVAVFKNNIWVAQAGQPFFELETYQGATFGSERDLYYRPGGTTAPSGGGMTVTNAVLGDPLFVNATGSDFHLQNGSPAKDQGTATVGTVVKDDFEGIGRPQGTAHDIGAFEHL